MLRDRSPYATADRVLWIRGGFAMQTPHSSASVASSGSPQVEQPLSPRNSTCVQQSGQKLCTSSTIVPQPAHRGGSAKSSTCLTADRITRMTVTCVLSPLARRRTSAAVSGLFDQRLRAMRLDRALRRGPELFLHERSFEDILDRLSLIRRRFDKALLIGRFEGAWRDRLLEYAQSVDVIDADALLTVEPGAYDLCVAASGLDTVEDLPNALLTVRFALREDSLLIGAVPGGETLPALRAAMRAADKQMGAATAHVHPRIEPAGLTSLLTSAGFAMPVVDVDRIQVTYKSLWDLIRDLRAMGATNILSARSRRPLSRVAAIAAAEQFNAAAHDGRVTELIEILHFAAWTPASPPNG